VHRLAQCGVCHLNLIYFYPVSLSADINLCTSRIRSLRLLSPRLWSSFHLQVKQLFGVLSSCEPAEMVQLGGGSGYCISADTAGIRCTTHWLPNLLVLVFECCASLLTHCHGSVSHELHCWLLGYINVKPLTVPVRCISASYSVLQNWSRGCGNESFYCPLEFSWVGFSHLTTLHVIRTQSFHNAFLQITCITEEMKMYLNKIPKWVTAKAKEGSCRPLEVEARVREIFGPVGNLVDEVAM